MELEEGLMSRYGFTTFLVFACPNPQCGLQVRVEESKADRPLVCEECGEIDLEFGEPVDSEEVSWESMRHDAGCYDD